MSFNLIFTSLCSVNMRIFSSSSWTVLFFLWFNFDLLTFRVWLVFRNMVKDIFIAAIMGIRSSTDKVGTTNSGSRFSGNNISSAPNCCSWRTDHLWHFYCCSLLNFIIPVSNLIIKIVLISKINISINISSWGRFYMMILFSFLIRKINKR